ncbi:MEDS domain-containing protein [Acetivibrio cellulolyticus]|uniref:MEDS domain-containing protein n=1 Tax=Acetivibrio cellulolyticus TaxID=35830 RepID=UPI0001E2F5A8|nr:MEDS domain-containing protein [Acetivibrio cellulolyticus]
MANCIQEFCRIRDNMESIRSSLEQDLAKDFSNLLERNVIKHSQSLDCLLFKCMKCSSASKIINILDIRSKAGKHSMFFYYCKTHLLVSLMQYIEQGIGKNELCYVFLQPDWYELLLEYLIKNNIPTRYVRYFSVDKVMKVFGNENFHIFRNEVLEIQSMTEEEGFSSVRLIGQCSYAISLTCKLDFLKFDRTVSDAIKGTNVSGVCLYDYYDYINESTFIEEDIIEESVNLHSNVIFRGSSKVGDKFTSIRKKSS